MENKETPVERNERLQKEFLTENFIRVVTDKNIFLVRKENVLSFWIDPEQNIYIEYVYLGKRGKTESAVAKLRHSVSLSSVFNNLGNLMPTFIRQN